MKQPPKAPQLDASLVGTRLEICWGNYISTEDNKTKVKMWCPAKVLRVADGDTDKGRDGKSLTERATKLAPRGMVLPGVGAGSRARRDAVNYYVAAPRARQVEWRWSQSVALSSRRAGCTQCSCCCALVDFIRKATMCQ